MEKSCMNSSAKLTIPLTWNDWINLISHSCQVMCIHNSVECAWSSLGNMACTTVSRCRSVGSTWSRCRSPSCPWCPSTGRSLQVEREPLSLLSFLIHTASRHSNLRQRILCHSKLRTLGRHMFRWHCQRWWCDLSRRQMNEPPVSDSVFSCVYTHL